jgi:hypothetical protein
MPPDVWCGVIAGLVIGLPLAAAGLSDPSPIYFGRTRSTPDPRPSVSPHRAGGTGGGHVRSFRTPLADVPTSPLPRRPLRRTS